MNQEKLEATNHVGQVSGSETKALSQQVFGDPIEFLRVLRNDFKQIAQSDPKSLSKNDLIVYSQQGSDEKGRLAAHIAAHHFDELLHMPALSALPVGQNILPSELDLDIKMAQGNVNGLIVKRVLSDGTIAAMMAGCTVGAGALSVGFGLEMPLVGVIGGLTTLATGAATGMIGKRAVHDPSEIRTKSDEDRKILRSWPEINGGKHS